jgi:hypothetical protein
LFVLLEGDWAPACTLAGLLEFVGVASPVENRASCLSIVEELVSQDLILVGCLTPKFEAWELPTTTWIQRLSKDWPTDKIPRLGDDPCWFNVTDSGLARLRELKVRFAAELDSYFWAWNKKSRFQGK